MPISHPLTLDLPRPRPEHVQKFKRLYKLRMGIELSEEESLDELYGLLAIVRLRQLIHNE